MAADNPRLRLSILGIVAVSMFASLLARLWYLQVIGTEEYQLAAEVQVTRQVTVEAPRGRILDAWGRVIVDNRVAVIVTIDPQEVDALGGDEADDLLLRLAEVLTRHGHPTKVADLSERLVDPRYNPIEARPVAVDVDEALEIYLIERHDEFPAVDVRREAVRVYPYGTVAAHVLGYVGRITEEEFADKMGPETDPVETDKPYERDDTIGKTGVERVYEDQLRGRPGVRTVEVDARGEPIRTLDYQAPVPGNDVQLTIDLDAQALAEAALRRGLDDARARIPRSGPAHRSPAGSVVVLDPRTGGVVAMASYPAYDPAEFVGGISAERYAQLLGDDTADDPFTNRAIAGQYAPGSTFKVVTAYAALRDGLIEPGTWYYDDTVYEAQGCTGGSGCSFRSPDGAAAQSVNVERALTVSSDTFFYWLGDRYWIEDGRNRTGIQDAAEDLGLHHETGVPLPFEQSGYIPTPERRQQRHDENPEAFPFGEWYSGDNIITAIGQGDVLVTPLQLANVYATLANGGTRYQPNLALRILEPLTDPSDPSDPSDPADVVHEFAPRAAASLDFPAAWREPMLRGLVGVTGGSGGTAVRAFSGWDNAAWPVAGKTGTAQVDGKADTALFVGWGPADDPRYTVAVILEESGFGGDAAAPVARWVLEALSGQVPLPEVAPVADSLPVPDCPAGEEDEPSGPVDPTATTTTTEPLNPLVTTPCVPAEVGGGR